MRDFLRRVWNHLQRHRTIQDDLSDPRAERSAQYKGQRYRVVYLGPTRHGPRAKLISMDGRYEFWVDVAALNDIRPGKRCEVCGRIDPGEHAARPSTRWVRSTPAGLLCEHCASELL